MSRTQKLLIGFPSGVITINDTECLGCLSTRKRDESVVQIKKLFHENSYVIIDNIAEKVESHFYHARSF
jgi:hypothetical protein